MNFQVLNFNELDGHQLYQLLQLRSEVFVLEQACAYQDIDGEDATATHLMGWDQGVLVAYARMLPAKNGHISIGRVVVKASHRHMKLGVQVMQRAIKWCQNHHPKRTIEISAQTYLTHFYQKLGFDNTGHFYLEDDIPHQTMVLRNTT